MVTISEVLDFGTWCRLGSCQCPSWHLVPLMVAEVHMPEVSTPVVAGTGHEAEAEALASDELLVEEVSIDGMCGVY